MPPQGAAVAPGFHVMAKPVGPLCNLRCRYCFYPEKDGLYPGRSDWRMPEEVLESFVRQYIEAQAGEVVSFAWQGGEPTLLGVDYFRRIVELQGKHAGGRRIENALQTNGVLLDDEWCAFLAANGFLVGISVDGPRELHDAYRLDRGGRPTFAAVMRGLARLERHGVDFNTLSVVHRLSARHALEVYRFLKASGSRFIQLIPLVEWEAGRVTARSVEPLQYGRFLSAIFDEWVRHDVGRCYVQIFDVALESWLGLPPGLCAFRETCGAAMVVEHNGDLYSCDHYVRPENRLGNLVEAPLAALAASARQREFGEAKRRRLPRRCRECDVSFACRGECPKNRLPGTGDGEDGPSYLCPGYELFFRHVDPYMRFMASELRRRRAPANVMAWARLRDEAAPARAPGRNDPCPCGSGRKHKKCCAREEG